MRHRPQFLRWERYPLRRSRLLLYRRWARFLLSLRHPWCRPLPYHPRQFLQGKTRFLRWVCCLRCPSQLRQRLLSNRRLLARQRPRSPLNHHFRQHCGHPSARCRLNSYGSEYLRSRSQRRLCGSLHSYGLKYPPLGCCFHPLRYPMLRSRTFPIPHSGHIAALRDTLLARCIRGFRPLRKG